MNMDKYAEYWTDTDKWYLEWVDDMGYLIIGHNEHGQMLSVVIEDDEVYELVCKKMIEAGVKILTPEESAKLYTPQLPDDFDIDAVLQALEDSNKNTE